MVIKFSLNYQSEADILLFYKNSGVPFNKIMKNALLCYFGADHKKLPVNPSGIPKIAARPVLSLDEAKDVFLITCMDKIPRAFRVAVIKSAIREYLKPYLMKHWGIEIKEQAGNFATQDKDDTPCKVKRTTAKAPKAKVRKEIPATVSEAKYEKSSAHTPPLSFAGTTEETGNFTETETQNIQNELFSMLSSF